MAAKKAASNAAAAIVAKQTEKLKKAADMKKEKETKVSKKDIIENDETSEDKTEDTEKPAKEKRAPTEYQLFRKQKLAELREEYDDDDETRPTYQDLMKMVNEAWREENPKKEKTPKAKTPKEKKERKTKVADGEEKKKRAPSAYNIFIKEIMPKIKSEHENDDPKLNQKDLMKIAAQKWNEHKATAAA